MKAAALLIALMPLVPQAVIADNDDNHFCFNGSEQVLCPDQINVPAPAGEPDESTPTK
jgi:hypothetical protein